ncbi:MAG: PQQ-binding-like beta-propeller repeat protein [Bacteroidota bacterium]
MQKPSSILLLFMSMLLLACGDNGNQIQSRWLRDFQALGTSSSPRCIDLTGDGVLDVVIGAGQLEFEASDSAVLALDGQNGQILWAAPALDQMVGSARFLDINGDQTPDVIIGGRSAQLMALDGKNGESLWRYQKPGGGNTPSSLMRYNFYNFQLIPDQNQDGLPDILLSNGGNVMAPPNDDRLRRAGVLAIMDSHDGSILQADTMPDGRETYLSPVVMEHDNEVSILFGSGGETASGGLYRVNLNEFMQKGLQNAELLLQREGQGFVAPPLVMDLNQDGKEDVVASWHGGEMIAIDGQTDSVLWQFQIKNSELNNSPAPGYFNADSIPDVFTYFSLGKWPENNGAVQVVLDGRDGSLIARKNIGCSGFSSPVVLDGNGDGRDEVIWSVNEYNCTGIYLANGKHRLLHWDVAVDSISEILPSQKLKNVGSTPWMGDLDGNGKLDIVYCLQANAVKVYEYFGIRLGRLETPFPAGQPRLWGGYLGQDGTGVWQKTPEVVQ